MLSLTCQGDTIYLIQAIRAEQKMIKQELLRIRAIVLTESIEWENMLAAINLPNVSPDLHLSFESLYYGQLLRSDCAFKEAIT